MRLRFFSRGRPAFVVVFALLCMLLPTAVQAAAKPASPSVKQQDTGSLTFTPNPAASGQTVTATGCGFPTPIGTVTVAIAGFGGVSPTNVTSAGPLGCYNVSFVVPSLAAGSYTVSVTAGGVTDSGTLAVNTSGAGTLTFSPNPASTGQTVTATGCGFPTPIGTVTVAITGFGGVSPTSVTATGSAGCYNVSFVVPSLAAGNYTVSVSAGGVTDSGTLAVNTSGTSTLTFTPNPAASGQTVTAFGCGFPTPIGAVTVTISGLVQASPTSVMATGSAGCYNISFVVPSLSAGSYTVSISAGGVTDSGLLSINTGAVQGTLTLTPNVASSGTQVTASGCGYNLGDTLTLTIYSSTIVATTPTLVGQPVFTGNAANGTACYTLIFIVPSLPNGTYTVSLSGTPSGNVDTGTLTVSGSTSGTSLSASPSTVIAGSSTTVTGTGFSVGSQVILTAFSTSQVVSAPAGSFSATVMVPAGTAPGTYTLTAVDTAGLSASTTIFVTAATGTLTPNVSSAIPGQVISVTGTGFAPNEQVSLSLAAPSSTPFAINGTIQLYQADSTGTISNVQYTVPNVAPGSYLLLALGQTSRLLLTAPFTVVSGAPTPTATPTATPVPPTSTPTPVPPTATPTPALPLASVSTSPTTEYFADGYTGTAAANGKVTFTERLFFYNPGTAASTVTTTYAVYNPANGSRTTVTKQDTVAAGATVSRLVNLDVGNNRMVSATVSASTGIVAEEMINRTRSDGTILDADSSLGSAHLSTTWNLAEGYTGQSLQEYITLYNPGTTAAHAQVSYLPNDTPAPAPVAVTVPANGQVTINVRSQYNALEPMGSKNIAAQITSDVPIAVDRAMYWGDGSGSAKYGYSLSPAVGSGMQSQYVALLPTSSGSQSFVTVLNPNDGIANVVLTLINASGTSLKTASASIKGHARYTFVVPSILPGDNGNVSGMLTSNAPVIAEAALYFGGSPNIGRHPGMVTQGSPGAPIGARADVGPGGALLRVFIPGTTAVRVQVTLGSSAGSSVVFDSTIAGNSAQEIQLPAGSGTRGVIVLASGAFTATLTNGGVGNARVWGGSLN